MDILQINIEFLEFLKSYFKNDFLRYEETATEVKLFFSSTAIYGNKDIYNLINQIYFRSDFPQIQNGGYRTVFFNNEKVYILNKLKDGKRN